MADKNSDSGVDIKTNACAAYELTKIAHQEVFFNNNPSYDGVIQANNS